VSTILQSRPAANLSSRDCVPGILHSSRRGAAVCGLRHEGCGRIHGIIRPMLDNYLFNNNYKVNELHSRRALRAKERRILRVLTFA
jgi:hypothetical protein